MSNRAQHTFESRDKEICIKSETAIFLPKWDLHIRKNN